MPPRPRRSTVTDAEMDRLVDACRGLDAPRWDPEHRDYMTNVLLTVLDLQMQTVVVDRSIEHFRNERGDDIRVLADLAKLLSRFPDDRDGNREVARRLFGNDHWTRVHWLRGFVRYLDDEGLTDEKTLESWARRSDYERDFAGRVKHLGPAAYRSLVMRLGVDTVKPDVWVRRYVEGVVGHPVGDAELVRAVTEAARRLGRSARELDGAIWEHQRAAPGSA